MAKVLLVEDDNNLREIYEARLQAEGYEIVSANDGEQALVVAKNEKPDLVISDVMMPKISGFEMLDILRNTDGLKDVKVIMLTALGQAEDKTRADQLGANRYLVKSQVTLEDIVKTAHQLLDDAPPTDAASSSAAPAAPEPVPTAVPTTSDSVAPTATPAPLTAAPADDATDTTLPAPVTSSDATGSTPPASDDATAATPAPAGISGAESTAQEEAELAKLLKTYEQSDTATPVAETPAPAAAVDPAPVAVTPEPTTAAKPATPAVTAESETAVPAVDPAPAPEPVSVAPAAPTTPVETAATSTAENDKTMAAAVESLAGAGDQKPSEVTAVEVAPEPVATTSAAPATTPEPAGQTDQTATPAEAETGEGVTIAHKKVINPINDLSANKQNITDLVAAEEAKEAAVASANAVVNPTPTVMPETTPTAPAPAATTPAPTPVQPGAVQPPTVDPNNIAL